MRRHGLLNIDPAAPGASDAQGRAGRRLVPARPATLALSLAGLVLALGTVAVASVAGTPRGTPASPPATPPPVWTVGALGLLLVAAAIGMVALLAAVVLPGRRWRRHDEPEQVVERPPLSAVQRLAVAVLPVAALGLFAVVVLAVREVGTGIDQAPAASTPVTRPGAGSTPASPDSRPASQPPLGCQRWTAYWPPWSSPPLSC